MKPAIDANDRWMAAASWVGWACGGPILPVVILAVSWPQRESLARRHALLASVVYVVTLAVWLPVFLFGILLRPESPAPVAVIVGVALTVGMLVVSLVGVVVALRSPLVLSPDNA